MINLRPLTRYLGASGNNLWTRTLSSLSFQLLGSKNRQEIALQGRERHVEICRRDELDPTIYNAKSCRSYVFTMSRPRMHLLESVAQSYHSGSALFSTSVRNGITPGTSHLSHISSTLLWK